MNDLFEAAAEVCGFMSQRHWKFCLIGGLALQQWGEPRTTLDADITLLTGIGEEGKYIRPLLAQFRSRIPNGMEFAERNRVLLILSSNGRDVDISLGALPFEIEMIARARQMEFASGLSLPCCTAEDLFIMKVFAGRPRDWVDAEGIVIRQVSLDTGYILDQLDHLAQLRDSADWVRKAIQLLGAKS